MRRRDRYGYHTYYGGGGPSPVIKVIVIVLAVVVLSLILTIVGLQRYMVYSSDGGKLVLPWAQRTDEDGSGVPDRKDAGQQQDKAPGGDGRKEQEPNVADVVPEDDKDKQTKKQAEQAEQEKKKAQAREKQQEDAEAEEPDIVVSAISATREDLLNGSAVQRLKDQKANAVVVEMKDPYGALSYVSKQPLAQELGTSLEGEQDVLENILFLLKLRGVYTIAYVDCFEDAALGNQKDYSIITIRGYRWPGPNKDIRWGSPTNARVRDYLTGIVEELAALGFDEVMLYNAGYPAEGNLNYIRQDEEYDPTQFPDTIRKFYKKAAKAARKHGAKLSVVSDPDTITSGENANSGQTLKNLTKADRVWVESGGADLKALTQTLTDAGMKQHPLGALTNQLEEKKDYCQAVLG